MRRVLFGAVSVGVAGALAASGVAAAQLATVAAWTPAHGVSATTDSHVSTVGHADDSHLSVLGSGVSSAAVQHVTRLRTVLRSPDGGRIGVAQVVLTGTDTVVTIDAANLKPGFHAVQVHGVGACVAPTFASAGPVLKPGGTLVPLLVGPDGTAHESFVDNNLTLASLTGPTGSSIVVHAVFAGMRESSEATALAAQDKLARIGCGVLVASKVTPAPKPAPTMAPSPTPVPTPTGSATPTTPPSVVPTTLNGPHW